MDLVNAFLEALRRSAIDCVDDCHSFPEGLNPETDVRDVPLPSNMQVIERNKKRYLHDPNMGIDYKYDEWKKNKKLVREG